ncbi:MAG: dockerin type I domain-containing protein [Planctomycetota bacterium]|nr:dockerin type I domain-containing protein [Planctomycetota bacterium]
MNEHGAQNPLSAAGESVVPYYDVNGDGNCTPLDVLLVIDALNRLAAGAEGELAANAEAAAAVWPTAVSPTAAPVAASANPTQAGKTAAASRLTNADNRRTAEVMSSTESLRLQVAESEEALSQADLLSPDDWDGLLDVLARGYPPEL